MKSSVLSAVFVVASLTVCANPQATPEIQWNPARAQAETAGFLKDLIRLDTRNPPGKRITRCSLPRGDIRPRGYTV
jgi:hypothetical protein